MIQFRHNFNAWIKKRSIMKNAEFNVAKNARVNFSGITTKGDCSLKIGSKSIIEGRITFEREQSKIFIGNNTFVGGASIISANKIDIGNDVLIAWGTILIDHNSHPVAWKNRKNDFKNLYNGKKKEWGKVKTNPIKVCDKAWIGCNSIILKGVTIGEGSVVGAGSVVTKNTDPYTVVAGNPAKFIRKIDHEE